MTFEERCIEHYGKIKRRIAWPAKRPIVMPPPREEALKARPFAHTGSGRNYPTAYQYDDEAIRLMRQRGKTMAAIADHFNIPNKTMQSYIRKHKARWEASP